MHSSDCLLLLLLLNWAGSLCHSSPSDSKDQKKTVSLQEKAESPKCYHCGGQENSTLQHFLVSCSKFAEIRSELLDRLRGELEAIGERGFQVWEKFMVASPELQSQMILGTESFGALEDEAINHFRKEYAARAWSESIVI